MSLLDNTKLSYIQLMVSGTVEKGQYKVRCRGVKVRESSTVWKVWVAELNKDLNCVRDCILYTTYPICTIVQHLCE